jgi:hypothetical protein
MQNGSLIRRKRLHGPEVWEFRWREPGPTGRRRHRRIVLGSTEEITEESAAREAVAALQLAMNRDDVRMKNAAITMAEANQHFRQRELNAETSWRTYSTRMGYQGYLDKWVIPRWGQRTLVSIQAGEVELWMRSLPLAQRAPRLETL